MILANWPLRASEELHSSTAPNRLVEAFFLPWSVSMSSDAPYWRPPSREGEYGLSAGVMVPKPVSRYRSGPTTNNLHTRDLGSIDRRGAQLFRSEERRVGKECR